MIRSESYPREFQLTRKGFWPSTTLKVGLRMEDVEWKKYKERQWMRHIILKLAKRTFFLHESKKVGMEKT